VLLLLLLLRSSTTTVGQRGSQRGLLQRGRLSGSGSGSGSTHRGSLLEGHSGFQCRLDGPLR
jgi:hypothetical protein